MGGRTGRGSATWASVHKGPDTPKSSPRRGPQHGESAPSAMEPGECAGIKPRFETVKQLPEPDGQA